MFIDVATEPREGGRSYADYSVGVEVFGCVYSTRDWSQFVGMASHQNRRLGGYCL